MRKAVVYARVSSKEQEQGFSLDAQLKLTRRYAGEHQFEVVREFSFWESAKQQGRKHFNEMLRFLRQNPDCRVIIVEKTDRLLRNLHDYVAIEDLVEELNAEVHLVKEGQIISKTSRSQDKLVHGMHVVLARNYILNMKEEITKGQTIKAEKGQYPGRAMFGYMHDRATRTIVANPKRGPVVTLIFDLYESGMHSMQSLQRKIREATGERISKAHLARMLKNRFYLGYFTWRGIEYKGIHPPLVKRDKFKRVQDVLSGRNVNKCRPHRLSLLFPFRGLLICSQCGCNLTAERHKGKYDYYRCSFSHGRHQAEWIKSEQLSAALSCVVDGIRIPEQVVRQIVESIRTDFSQIEAKRREQISRLNQRLSALRTRMSKSYDDKLEGKIDEQFWVVRHSEWMDEQHQLEAEMEKLQQPTAAADPALSAQKILELAQNAHSIYLAGNDTERANCCGF